MPLAAIAGVMTRAWTTCALIVLVATALGAQPRGLPGAGAPAPPATADAPQDPFGRSTPRGTVVGFLTAARKGDNALASHYLNAALPDQAAQNLAHQLFVVLDARLPARIPQVSDAPGGSRANPLAPDQERVGTIPGPDGPVDIVLERVARPRAEPIWLVSKRTLESVPAIYADVVKARAEGRLPRFLFRQRIGGVRLFDWLAVLFGLPALYFLASILNRVLTPLIAGSWRRMRGSPDWTPRAVLPAPARLLLLAVASRWLFATLPLSLLVRQSLSNVAALVAIAAGAWLLILVNGVVERHLHRRLPPANYGAALSLLRVGRRFADILVLLLALLGVLRRFGVDPTPVLAGLGVGGIAVALAAQKTLENVIAGASLIFDQAVRVGDFLKVGEVEGTVDHIGLRSTRIRTLNRSIVSVPNGQIANMVLETLSERDKFWFHPIVGLRYETNAHQMHAVIDGISRMLETHPAVDRTSVRVRFLRLGPFSLDVEVFAYVFARDWPHFLEIQEKLLFGVTEIVADAGTSIAFPSQTMYVAGAGAR